MSVITLWLYKKLVLTFKKSTQEYLEIMEYDAHNLFQNGLKWNIIGKGGEGRERERHYPEVNERRINGGSK